MPHVPKPVYPATSYKRSEITVNRYRYFTGDSPRDWVYEDDSVTSAQSYKTHTRTKPIRLKNGTLWKPVANFVTGYCTTDYASGRIRVVYKSNKRPYLEQEGQAQNVNLRYAGPYCTVGTSAITPSSIPSNVRNRLNTELMQKVGDRKVNYGESLAEAKQTVNHIAKSAMTFWKAFRAARKGDWNGVATHLDMHKLRFKRGQSPAEKWMGYQYGWLPLLGDIYDSTALLKEGFREKAMLMSEVRQLRDSHSLSASPGPQYSPDTVYGNSTVQYKAKVYFRIDDGPLAKLNQIGLINPLEVAWAVVPYSFVVDWFLPVGNFLEALNARHGVKFIDGYYGTRVVGSYTKMLASPDTSNLTTEVNTVGARTEVFAYRREKLTNFPVPGLYYKNPFSSTHLISAIAMLRQLKR